MLTDLNNPASIEDSYSGYTVTPISNYWMEHPHFTIGRAIVDKRKVSELN